MQWRRHTFWLRLGNHQSNSELDYGSLRLAACTAAPAAIAAFTA
jgi:hypothetical protein